MLLFCLSSFHSVIYYCYITTKFHLCTCILKLFFIPNDLCYLCSCVVKIILLCKDNAFGQIDVYATGLLLKKLEMALFIYLYYTH